MAYRAAPSGIALTDTDASIVKGMLARGDRQHDIAAFFGVNGGRIAEIATGDRFASVPVASAASLPPPGPYPRPMKLMAELEALKRRLAALEGRGASAP